MNETTPIHQLEAATIRDDLYNSVATLNHLTSMIKVASLMKQQPDDYFAEWIQHLMIVTTYTSHEQVMEAKAIEIMKYVDGEPRKDLMEHGIKLAQDYIKTLFSQGIVNYRE